MKRIVFEVEDDVKEELDKYISWGEVAAFYRSITNDYLTLCRTIGNAQTARALLTSTGKERVEKWLQSTNSLQEK